MHLLAKVDDRVVLDRDSKYQSTLAAMNFLQRYVKQNVALMDVKRIEARP